jgi:hypothetical protein
MHAASQSSLPPQPPKRLARSEWEARRDSHRAAVSSWTTARVNRAAVAQWHPVYDFLFDYYSYRPSHLERWSPGLGVILDDCSPDELDWPSDFVAVGSGAVIPALSFPVHRLEFLAWALRYLTGIAERAPSFCCFGLHEWAMVYKTDKPRHAKVPLRLSGKEIDAVVEGSDLRCTHYDAFRFFTAPAAPLNRTQLSREETTAFDQRGCIHVTMDLYKFATKIAPWSPSELVADAFLLAADAREIDMRASPYDLREYGFQPIEIETAEGREQYIHEQRRLAEASVPLRARLIEVYKLLKSELTA